MYIESTPSARSAGAAAPQSAADAPASTAPQPTTDAAPQPTTSTPASTTPQPTTSTPAVTAPQPTTDTPASTTPQPTTGTRANVAASSAANAAANSRASLAWLAGLDPTTLTVVEQAECLRQLERAESALTAARANVLTGFSALCGYADDGQASVRSWLKWQTQITGGAAAGAIGWMRRLAAHRSIAAALAAGRVSASYAREIADWSDLLPANARADADDILLGAAAAGARLSDLAGLADEMHRQLAEPDSDGDDDGFDDRQLQLVTHYLGAGKLDGDLTPRCAAALQAVLDALGKKNGPEDTRTKRQRYHDGLEEACRRLIAAGCLPDRAGQPTQIQLTMTLDQLTGLAWPDGTDSTDAPAGADRDHRSDHDGQDNHNDHGNAVDPGIEPDANGPDQVRNSQGSPRHSRPGLPQGWAGHSRPGRLGRGALVTAGDDCDASIAPIVIGHIDHELLGRLGAARADRDLVLGQAIALLSGPAGLAAWLRGRVLGGPAASVSLPLDVGSATETIPAHLRRSVIQRDRHCSFPGCDQLPAACQIHHVVPRSRGGPTKITNLALQCSFHHLTVIHRWGWRFTLNADGTTTATSPDGSRTLHSHGPPTKAV